MKNGLMREQNHLYYLTVDNRRVAKVNLVPTGKGWYLAGFLVYKRYRGRGYGNLLMAEILKLFKRRKKKSIFLWVADSNAPAIKIYEKHGFQCKLDDGGWRFYTYFTTD